MVLAFASSIWLAIAEAAPPYFPVLAVLFTLAAGAILFLGQRPRAAWSALLLAAALIAVALAPPVAVAAAAAPEAPSQILSYLAAPHVAVAFGGLLLLWAAARQRDRVAGTRRVGPAALLGAAAAMVLLFVLFAAAASPGASPGRLACTAGLHPDRPGVVIIQCDNIGAEAVRILTAEGDDVGEERAFRLQIALREVGEEDFRPAPGGEEIWTDAAGTAVSSFLIVPGATEQAHLHIEEIRDRFGEFSALAVDLVPPRGQLLRLYEGTGNWQAGAAPQASD
jgi:hypothetical protein